MREKTTSLFKETCGFLDFTKFILLVFRAFICYTSFREMRNRRLEIIILYIFILLTFLSLAIMAAFANADKLLEGLV